jgi:capsular exopolysaccharide synthesis family protein
MESQMSRIDDALRRAGIEAVASANISPVSSPWTFGPGAPQSVASPSPSRSTPEAIPAANPNSWRFREFSDDWRDRLIVSPSVDFALVEQFRRLAATLHHAQLANSLKVVMVTSAAPGEGKTMTSVNLSLVLSGSYGRRVLLMDADLRRPSIQGLVRMPDAPGLSDALTVSGEQKLPIVPLNENLFLLPAGPAQPDPMTALTSPRMQRILDEAGERFDWVIVDAPPVGPIADASLLAARVGAILFVVRAGRTPYLAAQKAVETLGREHILGIVLNGISRGDERNGHTYYHYSPSRPR